MGLIDCSKWFLLVPTFFLLSINEPLWAQADLRHNFSVNSEFLNTSSEYQLDKYSFDDESKSSEFPNLKFGIGGSYSRGKVSGLDFGFNTVNFVVEHEVKNRRLYFKLIFDERILERDQASQNLLGEGGVYWELSKSNLNIEIGQRSYAQDLESPTSIRENLRGPFYLIKYNLTLEQGWQLRTLHKTYFISDGNRRTDSDLALMYGISPGWPWIWLGLGSELMTNSSFDNTGYWSPRQLVNLGPRLDLAIPLSERYTFSLGLNVNLYNDVDSGDGTGYYLLSKMSYGKPDSLKIDAGVESINSEQNSNRWTSLMYFVGVTCPF